MEVQDNDLSVQFYNYISNLIGTEYVVKMRRQIFNIMDCVKGNPFYTQISSGSKGEGLDLKGSDIDIMFCYQKFHVYEHREDIEKSCLALILYDFTQIIMDTENTKPGFTLLKLNNYTDRHFTLLNRWCETFEGKPYISSTKFREYGFLPNYKSHGPCGSNEDKSVDVAECFRCHKWISCVEPWMGRSRYWPDSKIISRIVDYGVLFVPVGCKGSVNQDMEWRISFSVAEKELIHSFNHVQLLCYALLKILLKDIIKDKHGDLICSYFLKTIMFWLCEETDQLVWTPKLFLSCFIQCLKRLLYCVEYQTCLHYFIPEINFFEGRFTEVQHKDLLSTLTNLYTLGWRCILFTDTLQNFSNKIVSLPYTPRASFFNTLCISNILLTNCATGYSKAVFGSLHFPNKPLYINELSVICHSVRQQMTVNTTSTISNKQHYQYFCRSMHLVLLATNHDSVSGWLLLACLFYTCKHYTACLYLTDYCLSRFTSDKIIQSDNMDIGAESYLQFYCEKHGLIATMKNCTISPFVIFFKSSTVIPIELKHLKDADGFIPIPSSILGFMLKFLCFHHLNYHRGKAMAYSELIIAAEENYFFKKNKYLRNITRLCVDVAEKINTIM